MLLRLSVEINIFVVSALVCFIARKRAYNYALRIFGYLGGFSIVCIYSSSLTIPISKSCNVVVFFREWGLGGFNDPSI